MPPNIQGTQFSTYTPPASSNKAGGANYITSVTRQPYSHAQHLCSANIKEATKDIATICQYVCKR